MIPQPKKKQRPPVVLADHRVALARVAKLAPTYAASQITKPFPFNAFYPEFDAPDIDPSAWKLELSGLVRDKKPWTVEQLRALPQAAQITRHICIEGWSAIGDWRGVPFRTFLERIGADTTARYVGFKCADRYYSSIENPKHIVAMFVTNDYPGGYWEDQGYNWFSGI
jgi:DMSO/TMAO reductase YedYZ molybdopterin-dependent catalytic subunit